MTLRERMAAAALSPWVVVDAAGLLATFNDGGVLDPLDVQAAQTVGRLLEETDQRVLLAAALAVRGTRLGHVCIRLDSVRESVVVDGQDPEAIDALPWPEPEEWTAAVEASPLILAGDPPLVLESGRLYLTRYHDYERRVAGLIHSRIVPPFAGDAGSESGVGRVSPLAGGKYRRPRKEAGRRGALDTLRSLLANDPLQLQAAEQALESRFTVIAGGPGTGKTRTVATLLAALAADEGNFPLVALCAPTGKAAARLGEALSARAAEIGNPRITERFESMEPSTIHRLLGWSWERGRFAHHAANRLPHDLVIVDEMSMVSLPLAAKLLAAVRDEAAIVLVGDPYQLESIEAGTVLADIVGPSAEASAAGGIADCVVTLQRVHRYGEDSAIAEFAAAVRRGDADAAVELLRMGGERLRWAQDRTHPEFRELWQTVVEQRIRMVRLAAGGEGVDALSALGEMAVLCARRNGPDGVAGWSRDLEAALDERFTGLRWGGEWYPGRPVMITRNDYTLELYNGDIGVCVAGADGLEVVFDGAGRRTQRPSHLGEHATVHAMTIHKSQGSQFEEVVVALPEESSRLLTRELLYTAVTRARTGIHIVGNEAVVRAAVSRSVQRASGLGARLWGR